MNAVDASVERVLGAAHAAFADWHRQSVSARAHVLARAAELYEQRADALAEQMALDMGKPITQGVAEVRSCVSILSYYADNAADLLAPDVLAHEDGTQAELRLQAIGVVLGVMPWNYPHYQLIRCIAPNLLLGNAVAFKHASICAGSASLVEELFIDAGAPHGLVSDTGFTHAEVFDAIAHPLVSGVSFTGGERAGAAIAEAAGAALTKVVLELGGSDPFIVFDASRARELAQLAATMRLSNAGQTCVSPKRIIVRRDLLDQFIGDFAEEFFSALPGDPLDHETRLGPLSHERAADELRSAVRMAQQQGAGVRGSFERDDEDPRRFGPVVLLEPLRELPIWHEELFGPVAMIVGAETIAEAIELANDSPFGLGATVFADTAEAAERCATEIVAGMVSINRLKGGSPALPFGGVKRSGFGRELGVQGIREFANQKLVVIEKMHRR